MATAKSHTEWCVELKQWTLGHQGARPKQKSADEAEARLANWLSRALPRRFDKLGPKPSQQQLTPEEISQLDEAMSPIAQRREEEAREKVQRLESSCQELQALNVDLRQREEEALQKVRHLESSLQESQAENVNLRLHKGEALQKVQRLESSLRDSEAENINLRLCEGEALQTVRLRLQASQAKEERLRGDLKKETQRNAETKQLVCDKFRTLPFGPLRPHPI